MTVTGTRTISFDFDNIRDFDLNLKYGGVRNCKEVTSITNSHMRVIIQ